VLWRVSEGAGVDLVLFRHGIAIDRADPDCPADPERALTAKGEERTARAALGLAALGVAPRFIFTSPYVRARQTAEIAARFLCRHESPVVTTAALLPGASPRELLKEVRSREEGCVMCVGHAPDLDETLAVSSGAARELTHLKKAGAAMLRWERPADRLARLVWILEPRALRALSRARR